MADGVIKVSSLNTRPSSPACMLLPAGERPHIMVIARGIPTEENPMIGVFEFDQAQALSEAGLKVTVLAIDWRSLRHKRNLSYNRSRRGSIDVVTAGIPLGRAPQGLYSIFEGRAAMEIVQCAIGDCGRPDIVHAHFARQGELGLRIRDSYGIPLVHTEHSSLVAKKNARYIALAAPVWTKADAFVCVSNVLACDIDRICGRMPLVIGNVIDPIFLEGEIARGHDGMRLVSAGNLIGRKGFDVLIRAFAGLPQHATLEIFGEGSERKTLESIIDILNLSGRVVLRGRCDRSEMICSYRRADCCMP